MQSETPGARYVRRAGVRWLAAAELNRTAELYFWYSRHDLSDRTAHFCLNESKDLLE